MQLGMYWWKKLREKKISNGFFPQEEVWRCNRNGAIFLGIAMTLASLAIYIYRIYGINKITSHTFFGLSMIMLSAAVIVTTGGGIANLVAAGIALTRALVATHRFQKIFGFSPPVTDGGQKALESTIKCMLSIRARDLDEVYEREKKMLESIKNRVVYCVGTWDWLKSVGISVTSAEHDLGNLEKEKKRAKKEFYSARDAARNLSLPLPYDKSQLPDSYKEYLPKKAA